MKAGEFLARLRAHAPDAPALIGAADVLKYGALLDAVEALAEALRARGVHVLATQLDNGIAWAIADLAALAAGIVHVPLPGFFTAAQRAHVLAAAGVDTVLAPIALPGCDAQPLAAGAESLMLNRRAAAAADMHAGTAKITFTSGTTGTPKGVCLSAAAMFAVADSLASALAPLAIERHLVSLPLPVLLENIAGLYAPLLSGAASVVLPAAEVGLTGSSSFDPARLDAAVERHRADSVITLPQMLRLWTAQRAARGLRASRLKFVAAGGAAVGAASIAQARAVGLPAYEGYGLSEGASVQTLNLPHADRPGSVGKPLPHARVRVNERGEIETAGASMLGYLAAPPRADEWFATGDLGRIDADGFVHVDGRRKNVLITAFGRNVSPEWVETEMQSQPAIAHAVVFGDGQASLSAVLWPAAPDVGDAALAQAVAAGNGQLPDYAWVTRWVHAVRPFDAASGMTTANGRPRRDSIYRLHAVALETSGHPDCTARAIQAVAAVETPRFHRNDTAAIAGNDTTMNFFDRLQAATAAARAELIAAPIIQHTLRGEVSLPSYLAFLREAYHHVRHTVPLLQAARARLPERLAWMTPAFDEYVVEEAGHDEWILADIAACGGDAEAVRNGEAGVATEVMVAYAYDTIARGNPLGFLGMVHVLEGTSVALALTAADVIQQRLGLPDNAFTYLRSHGTLDREHTAHFADLVNGLDDAADQAAVIHAARVFYSLYGDVFRGLPLPVAAELAA